eukprot:c7004_g1_i1.p1 GENE.c7004_g1_i1~~c7004_g1_i1.p1  ORF type:complete len:641 (-),score=125.55 c7004_g1_i1:114-2036(-)
MITRTCKTIVGQGFVVRSLSCASVSPWSRNLRPLALPIQGLRANLQCTRKLSTTRTEAAGRCRTKPIVVQLKDVTKQLDEGRCLLKNIRLAIHDGEKVGVLGVNGAGKSSLLRIISGTDKQYTGETWRDPHLRMGYLLQEPVLDESRTVLENVLDGVREQIQWVREFDELSATMCDPNADIDKLLEKQSFLQSKIDEFDAWDLEDRAARIMEALRCPKASSPVTNLSGGERRRIALSRLLIERPQILLLDEPTNHLDATSVTWLQRYLHDYPGTVILVTHDRYFLENVTDWILEVDRADVNPFEGSYTKWLESKQLRLDCQKTFDQKQMQLLKKELEWAKSSRTQRNQNNKARMKRITELQSSEPTAPVETGHLMIPNGPRLGDLVIRADALSKHYSGQCLFEGLSFKLQRGWTVGVVGANGAGKSTLVRILLGQETPDSGCVTIGSTVTIGHLSQSRMEMNAESSVFEEISGGQDLIAIGDRLLNARAYVAQFNFRGADQQKKIKVLSGGERNRVHLAKALQKGCNVLILDEPTNDLDVDTLRALEEALPQFPGCAIVVSHDRWFLNRICTHILAFEGNNSAPVFFDGNYEEYETDRHRRMTCPMQTSTSDIPNLESSKQTGASFVKADTRARATASRQ